MKVVGIGILHEFCQIHRDVEGQIQNWLADARGASWQTTRDIKLRYQTASFLSGNRVVFNLKGNKYRLLTILSFPNQVVFVKKIGTHAEYDKWEL